jgi:hypothetical protein
MTRVIRIDFGQILFVVISCGVISFHEGERTGGYGMTYFGFDMSMNFAGDFDRLHLLNCFPCSIERTVLGFEGQ